MPNYPLQSIASAPEKSKPALEQLQKAFGILPNLPAVIANSPKLINALVGLFAQVHRRSIRSWRWYVPKRARKLSPWRLNWSPNWFPAISRDVR